MQESCKPELVVNRQSKKAMVVVCHPDPHSFNHALANEVQKAWSEAGFDVRLRDLYVEGFDPIITAAEARGARSLDPTVTEHIQELLTSGLLAVVHPNCWGAPPAMMKGWIDRVFAPQVAYTFPKGEDTGDEPIGLLATRAALVLNTGNTLPDREREHFGDPLERMWQQCILAYCGVPKVERRLFGVVATSTAADRDAWLAEARQLAHDLC